MNLEDIQKKKAELYEKIKINFSARPNFKNYDFTESNLRKLHEVYASEYDCANCTNDKEITCNGIIKSIEPQSNQIIQTECEKYKTYMQSKKIKDIINRSGLTENQINKTFDTIKKTKSNIEIYNLCSDYAEEKELQCGLYVFGKTGIGKTHFSIAIAIKRAMLFEEKIKYISISKFYDYIISLLKANDNETTYNNYLQSIIKSDFLIIDDFGTKKATDYKNDVIFQIIEERMDLKKHFIITSNLNLTELIDFIGGKHGERIVGRILESCIIKTFEDVNYRIEINKTLDFRKK